MSIVLGSVTLPAGLRWVDEMAWAPVRQSALRRLDGSLIVFAGAAQTGRPITLEADENYWITRSVVSSLATLALSVGSSWTLAIRGASYTVMFRHQDPPVLDLSPMIDYETTADDDSFVGKIKLMVI